MMISVSVYKEELKKVLNCPDININNIWLQKKAKEQGISYKIYHWKNPN